MGNDRCCVDGSVCGVISLFARLQSHPLLVIMMFFFRHL
jgi:hypothetical protein